MGLCDCVWLSVCVRYPLCCCGGCSWCLVFGIERSRKDGRCMFLWIGACWIEKVSGFVWNWFGSEVEGGAFFFFFWAGGC